MIKQGEDFIVIPMKIAMLIIGSEVLAGKITDLNTRCLAEFLRPYHLEINTAMTVSDEEKNIHEALKTLWADHDLIITSGGLGPTQDDITKLALASYFNRKVEYSADAEKTATENYARYNRPFMGKEHGYCYLPQGFVALSNSTGFAPGLFAEHLGKFLLSGPGVPREFKSMLEDHFEKLIVSKISSHLFLDNVVVRTQKVPEEKIFKEVDPTLWDKLSTLGNVSSLPILYGVDIGVRIIAKSASELTQKRAAVLKIFESSPVKNHIWHIGTESIEELIVNKALEKKVTFGFAESATGGLCSHRITGVPGSSQVFMGSVISYDTEVKIKILNVSTQTIGQFNVVSTEVAQEMAQGLQQNLGVDIAISTTGIAGPSGGSTEIPVGTLCVGFSTKDELSAEKLQFYGDRELLKNRFSQAALFALWDRLKHL